MTTDTLTIDGLEDAGRSSAPRGASCTISRDRAVVDLCTCIGEPVDRLESDDPAVIDYLRSARPDPD